MRHPLPAVAALALAAAACGNDKAERERFDRVQRDCATLVGLTLDDATRLMTVDGFVTSTCSAPGPIGAGDTCPGAPGPYTAQVCTVAYEFCASGTSLCDGGPQGGCAYACEVRVAAASPVGLPGTSVICATHFVRGQPVGPVSLRSCR